MNANTTLQILERAERAAAVSLSVQEILLKRGQQDLARLLQLVHVEAADAAEIMGRELELEVLEGLRPGSSGRESGVQR